MGADGAPIGSLARRRWPADPVESYRLRWVAHYAALGYSVQRIQSALAFHLPGNQQVTEAKIRADLRRLIEIQRTEALQDTRDIFGNIDALFKKLAEEGLALFYESQYPRMEPHDPETGLTRDKRQPVLLPAASHLDRSLILSHVRQAVQARQDLHYGRKQGAGVQVNILNAQMDANGGQIGGSVGGDSQELRRQAAQVAREMAEGRQKALPEPKSEPIEASATVIEPAEGSDTGDHDLQGRMDRLAKRRGTFGRMGSGDFDAGANVESESA